MMHTNAPTINLYLPIIIHNIYHLCILCFVSRLNKINTINGAVKKMEKSELSSYFMLRITSVIGLDPSIGVTTVNLDLRLSTLQFLHATTVGIVYGYLEKNHFSRMENFRNNWSLAVRKRSKHCPIIKHL